MVGKAYNIVEGVPLIKEKNPDLVFLDVEMPNGTGFDLLTHFHPPVTTMVADFTRSVSTRQAAP